MFRPVDLINPRTGTRYTARSAVDLNDRRAEGYVEPLAPVPPIPSRTFKVGAVGSSTEEASNSDD